MRDAFYDTNVKQIKFTKKTRDALWVKGEKLCQICKEAVELKNTHIDHILPLAAGGSNEECNLQILCKSCHIAQSQIEMLEHEYVKTSPTKSSFNSMTLDIIISPLTNVYPFIETFTPTNKNNRKLFAIDLIRSRKNSLYHSKHDFPLFTVMDEPETFGECMSYTQPGLYFIHSQLYFPIRGNGWHSHVMVQYLMEQNLITTYNIKYVLYSSLTTQHDYFNPFIDEIYDTPDGYEKLLINCMIGMCKPSKRSNLKSVIIGTDRNVIFDHYLKKEMRRQP